jgi:APA family basic amino acid/polyamine antiporter
MFKQLFTTKISSGQDGHSDGPAFKRVLTARHLVTLGVGAIVGAGIFVVTGQAAAEYAGPALVISFIIAGIACALAGLCYAEFAAMMPVSGSAYSYSYATLGEFVAWFVGWNLVLEYVFAVASVSVGWSGYFSQCLVLISHWTGLQLSLPTELASAPLKLVDGYHIATTGALINLPAVTIVAVLGALCFVGIRQSSTINALIVTIKVAVILLFLAFTFHHIQPANWHPFIPESEGPGRFGISGIFRGALLVCFSYLGFDAVTTAAGEAKNPQRDMPIGILGSLAICTVLYIAMVLTLTGIMPYRLLGTAEPVATALQAYPELNWLEAIVSFGALAGLSSVILVMLLGNARIFFSMSKDGLLPGGMGRIHPRYRTPARATLVATAVAAVIAGLFPIESLGELVSMGTLLAFTTVCIGVLVLRYTRPELPRAFRVPGGQPGVWVVCVSGALICLYLFWQSFKVNWILMLSWTVAGLAIYFFYGYSHSGLRRVKEIARDKTRASGTAAASEES